jgi:hypothetical protein
VRNSTGHRTSGSSLRNPSRARTIVGIDHVGAIRNGD